MSLFGDGWQLAVPSSVPHPGRARCLWVSCCITSFYIMVTVCAIIGLIHVDSPAAKMSIDWDVVFLLSSYLSKVLFNTALSQAWIWGDSLHCRALLEILPSPTTLLSRVFLLSSLQFRKQCPMSPRCAAKWCMSAVCCPLQFLMAHWGKYVSIFLPLPFFPPCSMGS